MSEREIARSVFRSQEGQEYLLQLLTGMHAFDADLKADDLGEHNAAMRILRSLGLLDRSVIAMLIKHFFSLDMEKMERMEAERNLRKANDYLGGLFPEGR